jgi:hypothetical protein
MKRLDWGLFEWPLVGIEELERMSKIHPELDQFYQDVKEITESGETLDWVWIINEAYRRLRESSGYNFQNKE